MSRCCLGLGGNLGDVSRTIARAVMTLDDRAGAIVAVSRLYRTAAVGQSAGDPFLNAAAVIETALAPAALLDRLHEVENDLGRTREVRWGPRTIDLDLLLYDELVLHNERLDVPHPGSLYRRFVLDPLAEISGERRHPETGRTIGEMRLRLLRRPLPIAVTGGRRKTSQQVIEEVGRRFPEVEVVEWDLRVTNCGQAPVLWLSLQPGGNDDRGGIARPTCLINLDAPRMDDVSMALSVVQAMTDAPVLAGSIPSH